MEVKNRSLRMAVTFQIRPVEPQKTMMMGERGIQVRVRGMRMELVSCFSTKKINLKLSQFFWGEDHETFEVSCKYVGKGHSLFS